MTQVSLSSNNNAVSGLISYLLHISCSEIQMELGTAAPFTRITIFGRLWSLSKDLITSLFSPTFCSLTSCFWWKATELLTSFPFSSWFSRWSSDPSLSSSGWQEKRDMLILTLSRAHVQERALLPIGSHRSVPKLTLSAQLNPWLNPACRAPGMLIMISPSLCEHVMYGISCCWSQVGLQRISLCLRNSEQLWKRSGNASFIQRSNRSLLAGGMQYHVFRAPKCRKLML